MVTGTLGLASPKTRAAMKAAAQLVKAGGGKVRGWAAAGGRM